MIDVFALDENFPFRHTSSRDLIIHAVETTQQGRFSTARRTNEGCDFIELNLQIDVFQNTRTPIAKVYLAHGGGNLRLGFDTGLI